MNSEKTIINGILAVMFTLITYCALADNTSVSNEVIKSVEVDKDTVHARIMVGGGVLSPFGNRQSPSGSVCLSLGLQEKGDTSSELRYDGFDLVWVNCPEFNYRGGHATYNLVGLNFVSLEGREGDLNVLITLGIAEAFSNKQVFRSNHDHDAYGQMFGFGARYEIMDNLCLFAKCDYFHTQVWGSQTIGKNRFRDYWPGRPGFLNATIGIMFRF